MELIKLERHFIIDPDCLTIEMVARFLDGNSELEIRHKESFPDKDYKEAESYVADHCFTRLTKCESPIELKFFVYSMHLIPEIEPQINVGDYRIDFAVPSKKIAIELDGHDFHKSRTQRTNDAKRDRFLQKQGWRVIRFTGTEVHADVFACIQDAKEIIENTK